MSDLAYALWLVAILVAFVFALGFILGWQLT